MTIKISQEETARQREFAQKVREINQKLETPPTAHVRTFGCQQNMSDGEKLKGMLAEMGYGIVGQPDGADVIIFNTCAVRENAEDRVFGNLGALKHEKRRNPNAIIAVCGCMVEQEHITERIKKSVLESLGVKVLSARLEKNHSMLYSQLKTLGEMGIDSSSSLSFALKMRF